jgi:DNA processing protein
MSFLRPVERCAILRRCRLAEFADLTVEGLAQMVGRRLGLRRRLLPPPAWLERGRADAQRLTAGVWRCTFLWEQGYPRILREIYDPPVVLFHRGGPLPPAAAALVAVVGTRQPTGNGRWTAYAFGFELARAGVPSVSGLARGVDLEVHRGSLAGWRGDGCATVAVLGCGIDRIYPASSREVAMRVMRAGCLVSEFAPGAAPFAHHFPQRNRIVAGLSRAVVVIEAPAKSGALITARCAAEQGRDVMIAAGGLAGARAAGGATMAEEGATSVVDAGDVLREIGVQSPPGAGSRLRAVQPPPGQRDTGSWLARMFAAEQDRQVAAADGGVAAADNENGTEHGTGR